MNKPHWQKKHDWLIDDIKATLSDRWFFKLLLRQYVDTTLADGFRETIRLLDNELALKLKEYQKIYCHRPNIGKLRQEIESC